MSDLLDKQTYGSTDPKLYSPWWHGAKPDNVGALNAKAGTSLVVQWLRIHLAVLGMLL